MRLAIVSCLDHGCERPCFRDVCRQQFERSLSKCLAMIVGSVVSVVPVATPAFHFLWLHQPVLRGMAEEVFESEAVRLTIAGEVGGETFAEQFAALLQHELEFLDAGCAVDVVKNEV